MSDEANMRLRLQNVAAYRDLRRGVRTSGRENVVFALVMFALAYYYHSRGAPPQMLVPYAILIVGELIVGLVKWVAPSAECMILDALVLFAFAGYNFWIQFEQFQKGGPIQAGGVFVGLLMLYFALGRLKLYAALRKLFAERPEPAHIAWFDELVYDILTADPHTDPLALDLPTEPHWRAKLLGSTVFFVANNGNAVWVAGPDDFSLHRAKQEHSPGRRKALLRVHGQAYPEFVLDDASWANYARWAAEQAAPRPA